jgi:hypothetical protein
MGVTSAVQDEKVATLSAQAVDSASSSRLELLAPLVSRERESVA